MAEDGMLLNFASSEGPATLAPKYKGGSWKERLAAKKKAQHYQEKQLRPVLNPSEGGPAKQNGRTDGDEESFAPPAKRARQNGNFVPLGRPRDISKGGSGEASNSRPTGHAFSQPREVISSLFSYNPTPKVEPTTAKNVVPTPVEPSNAPLVDGADTFASLGLSNALANHLVTKLGLKKPTAIQKSAISYLVREDSDAFIRSETGSGKTLAYLLPLLQRIMSLSKSDVAGQDASAQPDQLHRDSGLFALILAPTRELSRQICAVLDRLLGCARWLVAGAVLGGEKKKGEKARLRKGLNILVATPGRLADHLENTKVLDVSNVRWLVLDEGDQLMDMGFEDEIQRIMTKLDQGRKDSKIPGLPGRRTTVLCSATMKMNVQRLGDISLKDAELIKPDEAILAEAAGEETDAERPAPTDNSFYAPAQLQQSYTIAAAKLRLVTLSALLKTTFSPSSSTKKAIIFFSCADSVDFHFSLFTRALSDLDQPTTPSPLPTAPAPIISPNLTVSKIHGTLPQKTRTAILSAFSVPSTTSSAPHLLLATDVAARGLDLPDLDLVIEYDPPFSSTDHLHRIGRTARLGRPGRAMIFLLPGSEEGYVEVLRNAYRDRTIANIKHTPTDTLLQKGFSVPKIAARNPSGKPSSTAAATPAAAPTPDSAVSPTVGSDGEPLSWRASATSYQLSLERWILSSPDAAETARRAFRSHVRAYATHAGGERKWFDRADLHLGHLCKSFGLRETPVGVGGRGKSGAGAGRKGGSKGRGDGGQGGREEGVGGKGEETSEEAQRKMRRVVGR